MYFQFHMTCTYSTIFLHTYTISSKGTATWMLKEAAYFPGIHTDDHISGGFSTYRDGDQKGKENVRKN